VKLHHIALCLVVCLLWSGNFVAVKIGLDAHMTPFLLTALRFLLACCLLPFVQRPAGLSLPTLACIGLLIGVGQFGLASLSVAAGLSAGVVALVLQTQVLFTIGLAAGVLREPLTRPMIAGTAISLAGLTLLVAAGARGSAAFCLLGLGLAVAAAAAAAASNILIKRLVGPGQSFRLAVWISPFPILPLLALSALTEGSPLQILARADHMTSFAVVVYGGLASAVGGTAIWAWLLRRHPASRVALFTPAIPVFAFVMSALVFGQPPQTTQSLAVSVVLLGLLIAAAPRPLRHRWGPRAFVRQEPSVAG
jgi:O-acetylserine/cysteine efflux transporter